VKLLPINLSHTPHDEFRESTERAVIRLFYISRESAGGEFFHFQVVADALAAFSLAGARLVGAVTGGSIG